MSDDVAMFPLGTVLVPGAYLPLHVFEPRYLALVDACLEGSSEFGVALIERGSEVGGGDQRSSIGCMARIVEAVQLEDGRRAIGTVGVRRIRIDRWLPDAPYPRAEVSDWPDLTATVDAVELLAAVVPSFRRVLAMASELGEAVAPATVALNEADPVAAGYEMAALAPIGPLDRQHLLAAASPEQRLRQLASLLDDEGSVLATPLQGDRKVRPQATPRNTVPDQARGDASLPTMVSDLWELIRTYAKQETIGPLKGLGRSVALGIGGSLILSVGLVLLTLAALRALQTETGTTFDGSWSFAPYLLTVVGVAILIAACLAATRKRSTSAGKATR